MQNQQSPLLASHNSTTARRGGTLATLSLEEKGDSRSDQNQSLTLRYIQGQLVHLLEPRLQSSAWEKAVTDELGGFSSGCVCCVCGADLLWSVYVYNDTTEEWDALNIVQTMTLYVLSGREYLGWILTRKFHSATGNSFLFFLFWVGIITEHFVHSGQVTLPERYPRHLSTDLKETTDFSSNEAVRGYDLGR